MCINSCWELYGAVDRQHLPGNGSSYDIQVTAPSPVGGRPFPWVAHWDEDEGANRSCAGSKIRERHNATVQHISWDITMPT